MVESWYLSPQWTQSSKVSRGLLRCGPSIGLPQPSDVDPVTSIHPFLTDLIHSGTTIWPPFVRTRAATQPSLCSKPSGMLRRPIQACSCLLSSWRCWLICSSQRIFCSALASFSVYCAIRSRTVVASPKAVARMVALSIGLRARMVLADVGETARYSDLTRLIRPARGPISSVGESCS